jgi:hypothetical protein
MLKKKEDNLELSTADPRSKSPGPASKDYLTNVMIGF